MNDSDPIITPGMTLNQIAELLERHNDETTEVFVKVHSIKGKPIAFLVREEQEFIPPHLRRRA